jgi:hypothetical protein
MKQRFVGRVRALLGYEIREADVAEGRVRLVLAGASETKSHAADHLIAATGYRIDVRRLTFVSTELLDQLHSVDRVPVLSTRFESSVPGLYFAGMAAMYEFGPVMRFVCGAEWTARRLTRTFARGGARTIAASLGEPVPASPT